ncbi:MAG: hypothetical protein ACOYI4_01005 [Christensenellales bacterium]|jgi:hypothetical protein
MINIVAVIKRLLTGDWIVEQSSGTNISGNLFEAYAYKKWANGLAEIEYRVSNTSGVTTTTWSSIICYGDYTSWSNVFNNICDGIFIDTPYSIQTTSTNSQFIAIYPFSFDKNGVLKMRFISVGAKTSAPYGFSLRAIGRWK